MSESRHSKSNIILYQPDSCVPEHSVRWLINGARARLIVWTDDEFHTLAIRPHDAQWHQHGFWCALRIA